MTVAAEIANAIMNGYVVAGSKILKAACFANLPTNRPSSTKKATTAGIGKAQEQQQNASLAVIQ